MSYDLIVLGGGPGGYLAAERAGQAGLKAVVIEKNKLGGVCLNEGCIPSKTLLNSAKILDYAHHGSKYGVTVEKVSYDVSAVIKRKNKIVRNLVAGVKSQLKSSGVELVYAEGKISGRSEGIVHVTAGDKTFSGKNLIIATGSEAIIPPIPGVKEGLTAGYIMTNREILDLEHIPDRLTVVGGGVIGLELASYFQSCGSQVTVIEMLDHIAGNADRALAAKLQKTFEKNGIIFHLNAQVIQLSEKAVTFKHADGEQTVETDLTLLSVGRRPVTQNIGAESIGLFIERGRIKTDDQGRTNVPGVYAVGDVNGAWMLAHAAYREAEVAVNTIIGKKDRMRYQAMPSVLYTQPELAFVGETEATCKDKGIEYKLVKLPMQYSGRYMAENEGGDGEIKLLIDKATSRIIGCHLLGAYASEIILAAGMMIETEMRLEDIKEMIFPHPTVSEILREAIFHA